MPHCGQFSQKLVHSLALTIVHSEYFKEYWRHHISIQAHNSVSWSTFGSDSSLFGYDATSFVLVDFGIFCYFPQQILSVWMGTVGEQPLLDPSRDVWLGSGLDSGWDTQESLLSHLCFPGCADRPVGSLTFGPIWYLSILFCSPFLLTFQCLTLWNTVPGFLAHMMIGCSSSDQTILFLTGAFLKNPKGLAFTEDRLQSGQSDIYLRSVKSFCESPISTHDHQVLTSPLFLSLLLSLAR